MVLPSSNEMVLAWPLTSSPTALAGGDDLCPEPLGLSTGRRGELGARDAHGEAEVVLDARAAARLAARRRALDEHGLQTLGCAVHRGGKSCGASADDREVVHLQQWSGRQPEHVGQLAVGRLDERLAALGDDHGQLQAVEARRVQQLLAL